jgi:hypothetical protein
MQAQNGAPEQPEMLYVGTTERGLTSRDGLWLAIAVIAHAGLLLAPINPEPPGEPAAERSLLIELKLQPMVEQPFVQPEPLPEPDPPPDPTEPKLPQQQTEPPPVPVMEIAAEDENAAPDDAGLPAEKAPAVSTALLLQSAADQNWSMTTEGTTRKLGVFVPREMPQNWRPGITLEDNLFNGMTAPRKIEIVDRWISPDGSQNVVINTPAGETLCGRGLAWDPMRPLVENIIQYRPCGGGGKRTFEMPARYLKNADNSGIANSTSN